MKEYNNNYLLFINMYCSDFLCTYKLHKEEESEDIYRLQFLQAFQLDNWDDDKIEKETQELFSRVKSLEDFKEIFDKLKQSDKFKFMFIIMGNDDYTLFKVLFMYDLFDLAHKCFCDILNNGIINIDNKNMLLNNI